MPLEGKVAIIAGGAHGIGQATAQLFAQKKAKIILADKDEAGGQNLIEELTDNGFEATFINCDVSERLDVLNLMAATLEAYGQVDILINAAAIRDETPFLELTEEKFEAVIDVNLKGAFLLGKAVSQQMMNQTEAGIAPGVIIYLSSLLTVANESDNFAFSVANGGLGQLTKAMAETFAPHGIRVNTISASNVMGRMLEKIITNESKRKKALELMPSGRFGEPNEIAEIAAFLVSPEASYLTGQIICANGGSTSKQMPYKDAYMIDHDEK